MSNVEYCTRCGRFLDGTIVWLDLNRTTGKYSTPGETPLNQSQGEFAFGKKCADREIGKEKK